MENNRSAKEANKEVVVATTVTTLYSQNFATESAKSAVKMAV